MAGKHAPVGFLEAHAGALRGGEFKPEQQWGFYASRCSLECSVKLAGFVGFVPSFIQTLNHNFFSGFAFFFRR